ncbi:alpha/beta fold hydrolase [[Actinomadura] parvosata]|uniref:alpha/beta fold hydrolase n=1 Tax=[Actinomadura] parvosata TaxID=1955412 RepID=UPI00406D1D47
MIAVFVHGVPETAEVWDRLRGHLPGRSLALRLPGFGTPRPEGFGCTGEEYARWLAAELRALGEPVHLVGHDWGTALVLRVATGYDVPLRSWAVDAANGFHPGYAYHDLAKVWQTPGAGEVWMASVLAREPQGLARIVEPFHVPEDEARLMEERFDEEMGRAILDLYRSAVPNHRAIWQVEGPTRAPGMVLVAERDPFTDPVASAEVAAELGARVRTLREVGHWWMAQDPRQGAEVLRRFWDGLQ